MSAFTNPAWDNHESVHFFEDQASGLRAIIALHSTALGPAAGGCRMWDYENEEAALRDALRLSKGMSYKNAMAGLAYGGGKSVILGDPRTAKTPALFEAFGRAVDSLGGKYVTAEDVGVSVEDMVTAASQTRHVSGIPMPGNEATGGDPSPFTARGIFAGIRAAAKARLDRDDLVGLTVAVQGLGHVGLNLCKLLDEAGTELIVADINEASMARAVDTFKATPVNSDEILFVDADVIAPCAMGAILNKNSIPKIQAPVIAGGANNQLEADGDGTALMERDILYAPDYVINAGGIINVVAEYEGAAGADDILPRVDGIYDTLMEIFAAAEAESRPTNRIADDLARARMAKAEEPEKGRLKSSAA